MASYRMSDCQMIMNRNTGHKCKQIVKTKTKHLNTHFNIIMKQQGLFKHC